MKTMCELIELDDFILSRITVSSLQNMTVLYRYESMNSVYIAIILQKMLSGERVTAVWNGKWDEKRPSYIDTKARLNILTEDAVKDDVFPKVVSEFLDKNYEVAMDKRLNEIIGALFTPMIAECKKRVSRKDLKGAVKASDVAREFGNSFEKVRT